MKQNLITRRAFALSSIALTALALSCLPAVQAADAAQWEVFETSYESAKAYPNAFTEVEDDVVFQQGDKQWKVPAFWAGDKKWTVRFAPPVQGMYTFVQKEPLLIAAGVHQIARNPAETSGMAPFSLTTLLSDASV